MTGLIIAGSILLFFALLLLLPIHLTVTAEDGVRVTARILCFRYTVFPLTHRKRGKKRAKAKNKIIKKREKKKPAEKAEKKQDLAHTVRLVTALASVILRKLAKHLRVRVCRCLIAVTAEDAAKTALLYGAVSGAVGTLFGLLSEVADFKVKKSAPVRVFADFTGQKSRISLKIDFSMTVFGGLCILFAAALAFVKQKNQNKS